jgi:oxygen-independent coproporphyrinogen-3 oxidase
MAYKPWVAKYQVQMLAEGPLPDFLERKEMMEIIHKKLESGGYIRSGFECYSLPDSPMTKAFKEGEAHYGASGHQPGGRVNFVAVGSSSMSNLGNDYYVQNFYDLPSYKKALDQNLLPSFRGLRLNDDDKIRQHATQQIRSYFKIDYKNFKDQFGIDAKNYFKKEIEYMSEMQKDGLVEIMDNGIFLTEIGRDFTQNIMNVFDSYDPPGKSYKERLETVKKAKESQATVQEKIDTIST